MFKFKVNVSQDVRTEKELFQAFLEKARELEELGKQMTNNNGGIYIQLVGRGFRNLTNEAIRNAMDFDFLYNYNAIQKNPELAIQMAEATTHLKEFNKQCRKRRKELKKERENIRKRRSQQKGNIENETKEN